MKLSIFSLFFLAFAGVSTALFSLEGVPECGLTCMIRSVGNTTCAITDEACMCADAQYQEAIKDCLFASCTTRDIMTTSHIAKVNCNTPVRDEHLVHTIICWSFFSLATFFVVLRVLARSPRGFELMGWDDWTIIAAWIFSIPLTVASEFLVKNGLGTDIWNVTYENVSQVLFWFWVAEFPYLLCTVFTKLSICAFYLRVFPDKNFRKYVFAMMGLIIAILIAFVLLAIFQCQPVSYSWYFFDNQAKGRCVNLSAALSAASVCGIVYDLLLLALPLPCILKLQLFYSWKTKTQISLMFSIGLLVTIVSVIRFHSLLKVGKTINVTWDFGPAAYWSGIEMWVGIVCACMPAARVTLARMLPVWVKSTMNSQASEGSATLKTSFSKFAAKFSFKRDISDMTVLPKTESTSDFLPLGERVDSAHSSLNKEKDKDQGSTIVRVDEYQVTSDDLCAAAQNLQRMPDPFGRDLNRSTTAFDRV